MAESRHIGNGKFVISPQPFNRSRRNFARTCRLWLQTVWEVNIYTFQKFKILDGHHIGNRKFPISLNRSTNCDEILCKHADCGYKPCRMLKFAYFTNSIWRTDAILEIENLRSPQPFNQSRRNFASTRRLWL